MKKLYFAICIKQFSDVPEEVNTKESIVGLLWIAKQLILTWFYLHLLPTLYKRVIRKITCQKSHFKTRGWGRPRNNQHRRLIGRHVSNGYLPIEMTIRLIDVQFDVYWVGNMKTQRGLFNLDSFFKVKMAVKSKKIQYGIY